MHGAKASTRSYNDTHDRLLSVLLESKVLKDAVLKRSTSKYFGQIHAKGSDKNVLTQLGVAQSAYNKEYGRVSATITASSSLLIQPIVRL